MRTCLGCGTELEPDSCAPKMVIDGERDDTYQYHNALWIGFHGGYGMFTDNLEVKLPINSDERWLRNSDERDEFGMFCDFTVITTPEGEQKLVDDPDWIPEYREDRMLPGQPDYEAVICHECAHALCDTVPWIHKLIEPHRSHAHKQRYHDDHPDHYGWDYDRQEAQHD